MSHDLTNSDLGSHWWPNWRLLRDNPRCFEGLYALFLALGALFHQWKMISTPSLASSSSESMSKSMMALDGNLEPLVLNREVAE